MNVNISSWQFDTGFKPLLPTGVHQEDSTLTWRRPNWFGLVQDTCWRKQLRMIWHCVLTLVLFTQSVLYMTLEPHWDCELSMMQYVIKVTSSCFYHFCRLKQIRQLVGK